MVRILAKNGGGWLTKGGKSGILGSSRFGHADSPKGEKTMVIVIDRKKPNALAWERKVLVRTSLNQSFKVDPQQCVLDLTGVEFSRSCCIMSMAQGMTVGGNTVFMNWNRAPRSIPMPFISPPTVVSPLYWLIGFLFVRGSGDTASYTAFKAKLEANVSLANRLACVEATAKKYLESPPRSYESLYLIIP
ncbi:hypothetical protein KBA73_03455 [Patescibacteria group bacterium]|nr:hypothetical protein [Patescibacteria group bacterium]